MLAETLFQVGRMLLWALIPGLIVRMLAGLIGRARGGAAMKDPYQKQLNYRGVLVGFVAVYVGYSMLDAMSGADMTYYELLRVPLSARHTEIKKSYHAMSLELHPDKGGSEELFVKIRNAYEVLKDAKKRQIYDKFGPEAFTCKHCSDEGDYFHYMIAAPIAHYVLAVVITFMSTNSQSRASLRNWLLFALVLCAGVEYRLTMHTHELKTVVAALQMPAFHLTHWMHKLFYVVLAGVCILASHWGGDHRSEREILKNVERQNLYILQSLDTLQVCTELVMSDEELRTRFKDAMRERVQQQQMVFNDPRVRDAIMQASKRVKGTAGSDNGHGTGLGTTSTGDKKDQ